MNYPLYLKSQAIFKNIIIIYINLENKPKKKKYLKLIKVGNKIIIIKFIKKKGIKFR